MITLRRAVPRLLTGKASAVAPAALAITLALAGVPAVAASHGSSGGGHGSSGGHSSSGGHGPSGGHASSGGHYSGGTAHYSGGGVAHSPGASYNGGRSYPGGGRVGVPGSPGAFRQPSFRGHGHGRNFYGGFYPFYGFGYSPFYGYGGLYLGLGLGYDPWGYYYPWGYYPPSGPYYGYAPSYPAYYYGQDSYSYPPQGSSQEQQQQRGEKGALNLGIRPRDSQVYLNGQFVGKVSDFDGWPQYLWLEKGTYDIVFYKDGYKTLARQVTIYPGLVISWDDRLERGQAIRPEDLPSKSHERRDSRIQFERRRSDEIDRQRGGSDWQGQAPANRGDRNEGGAQGDDGYTGGRMPAADDPSTLERIGGGRGGQGGQ
nr:PEGA domain-containing protein [Acidobacteriota bacterium]